MNTADKHTQLKIKVCGMKYADNMLALSELRPDYMGFIFYPKSPRNFEGDIPKLPAHIKKTGVFVDASFDYILEKVKKYNFRAIQLHGNESAAYCQKLKTMLMALQPSETIEICKVFGIKDTFDFGTLVPYEDQVDYFLFDTKGTQKGGNGYRFDWTVLETYPSTKPFLLSGGIGPESLPPLQALLNTKLPILGLDLNSKFEDIPGSKNIKLLHDFIIAIRKQN